MKRMISISVFYMFLSLTGGGSLFAQSSNSGENQIQNPEPDRIWAQTLEGSHFNEFWNYQFYFDNGMKLHLVYNAANFGSLKSPVTGARASIYFPDGRVAQVAREYPLERLVQDKEKYRFILRPDRDIYFEGKLPENHRVVMITTKDGVRYHIDLTFKNIQPGYMKGDGKFNLGNDQIGIVTHIPYAEVSGTVKVNNRGGRVRGTAYMDHTHQHQTTTRLMDSGYRVILHEDRQNWKIIYTLLPEKPNLQPVGYLLSSKDASVELHEIDTISTLASGDAFGKSIPRILNFKFRNSIDIQISRTEDQERFSLLSELGWVARRAARTFLGGEVVDFRGTATIQIPSERPKQAEYNFFIVD